MKIFDFFKRNYLIVISLIIIMNIISFFITKFEFFYLVGIFIFGFFSIICNFVEFKLLNKKFLSSRSKIIFIGLLFYVFGLFIYICIKKSNDNLSGILACASIIIIVDLIVYKVMDIQEN